MKTALAVIAGYLIWSVLWLGGGAAIQAMFSDEYAAFTEGGALSATAPLLCSLALSLLCSLASGWTCAKLGNSNTNQVLWILIGLLILTGIGVQASIWNQMPLWYHLVFLALLAPFNLLGARRPTLASTSPSTRLA